MQIDLEDRTFYDIDEESKCMVGYDQKYQQLSRGSFQGHYQAAHFGSELKLYFEQNNQVLEQSAVTPSDRYSVIFLMNEGVPSRLNGKAFSHDNLFLCGPRSTFDTVGLPSQAVPGAGVPGPHFAAVSIEQDFFETMVLGCDPDGDVISAVRKHGVWEVDRQHVRLLRAKLWKVWAEIRQLPSVDENVALGVRTSISELLSDYLLAILQPKSQLQETAWSKPYRMIRRAREYMTAFYGADVSINGLCRELGVSRRAFEYYFRDQVGLSPTTYLRSVRLNETRRALLAPENTNRSIGDLAAEAGFWHPSRFATYYRNQFGELPSQTSGREVLHSQPQRVHMVSPLIG